MYQIASYAVTVWQQSATLSLASLTFKEVVLATPALSVVKGLSFIILCEKLITLRNKHVQV